MVRNKVSKWWYLLLSVSCLHLFFINIKNSHDWGDDFAQYIHQAENITQGISQMETGYIYNKDYPLYSPPLYFIGFPLLLAPVYIIAGNSILAFSYLISAFLFLSAIVFFKFFNSYFKPFASYLLVLIIACNPWILNFKAEIGSDIPFTFFLFLSVLIYLNSKKSARSLVIPGLFAGFLFSIRNIGIAFLLAVIINEMLKIKKENSKSVFLKTGIFLLTSIGFFVLINTIIFDIPLANIRSSSGLFTFNGLYKTVLKNINYYFEIFQSVFNTHPENIYALFSTLIKSFTFSLILLGFYLRLKRGIGFVDILLIVYMSVLYVYPYSASGYRFLIPVTPILLLYAGEGLFFLMDTLHWKKPMLYVLCIVSFYAAYKFDWEIILNDQNMIVQGPQRMDSKIAFDYIKANTEKNGRILFKKPRALALYTDRNCFLNNPDESIKSLYDQIADYSIEYILINDEISDEAIKIFIRENPEKIQLLWSNSVYHFYKVTGKG